MFRGGQSLQKQVHISVGNNHKKGTINLMILKHTPQIPAVRAESENIIVLENYVQTVFYSLPSQQ